MNRQARERERAREGARETERQNQTKIHRAANRDALRISELSYLLPAAFGTSTKQLLDTATRTHDIKLCQGVELRLCQINTAMVASHPRRSHIRPALSMVMCVAVDSCRRYGGTMRW